MTQTIYIPVHRRAFVGYVYQLTEDSPLMGPFDTREAAVADARWHMHNPIMEVPVKAATDTNLMAKARPVDRPYQVFTDPSMPGWEWRVLKRYQKPSLEAKNPYARAFCAVRSPMTYGSWDLGDTYLSDIGRTLVSEDI